MAASQHYFMKWNNYQSHISNIFLQLYQTETLVDVTVCADGVKIQAHRVILSACSPYFQNILSDAGPNPILLLHDISSADMRSILDFVYRGELHVASNRCSSLLKAANNLQISGLMEVSKHLPDLEAEKENVDNTNENNADSGQDDPNMIFLNDHEKDSNQDGSSQMEVVEIYTDVNEQLTNPLENDSNLQIVINTDSNAIRKGRKGETKRDYSDSTLAEALTELTDGKSLADVCSRYAIPRSTLYSRARGMGIAPMFERREYSQEHVQAAVQAVADGSSLKRASETFNIPKTVLWRKVQREFGRHSIRRRMRKYTPQVLEAACDALLNGHNITRVSNQFKIPTSTLFREKQRLVREGKLPKSSINTKRTADMLQQIRLDQAVAACIGGKMSQALASQTFQVPKTTIWRRLQKSLGDFKQEKQRGRVKPVTVKTEYLDEENSNDPNVVGISEEGDGEEFHFSEVVPMTYLNVGDGSEINEHSLIILTPSNEAMDLQNVVVEEEITEISAEDAQADTEEDEGVDGQNQVIDSGTSVVIDPADLGIE